jgi:hypothetical protein
MPFDLDVADAESEPGEPDLTDEADIEDEDEDNNDE